MAYELRIKLPDFMSRIGPRGPINHQALSAGLLVLLTVSALISIQIFGDPRAARPHRLLSLAAAAGAPAFHAPLSAVVVDPNDPAASADPSFDLGESADSSAPPAADAPAAPLVKAPIAKLIAKGPMGPLPIIAADGTTPRSAYRRPFPTTNGKPIIGLIVGGLGFNAAVTQAAIDELPADVTLSFVPYADNLQGWIDKARARGHEVLLELPMEPFDPQDNDTGPQTLLASAQPKDNLAKLDNLLSRGAGYFGVSNYQGAKFAMSDAASAPVVNELKQRGLAFVSNGIGQRAALGADAAKAGLPFAAADRVIDTQRDADSINDQLLNLETLAQQSGAALGAGFAFPITVTQVKTWAANLADRGFVLAPASAIVDARNPRH